MDPRNLSDRDCRIAKRQLAVGNQAAAGNAVVPPAARDLVSAVAESLGMPS